MVMSPAAEGFAPSAVPGLALRGSTAGTGALTLQNTARACARGGRWPMMSLLEPGKEGFDRSAPRTFGIASVHVGAGLFFLSTAVPCRMLSSVGRVGGRLRIRPSEKRCPPLFPHAPLSPPACSVLKRLKKLEKEADGYADTDQADLADGLKDDIADTRSRVEKARQGSKSRIMKKLAMGVAAAGEATREK